MPPLLGPRTLQLHLRIIVQHGSVPSLERGNARHVQRRSEPVDLGIGYVPLRDHQRLTVDLGRRGPGQVIGLVAGIDAEGLGFPVGVNIEDVSVGQGGQ